MIKVAMIGAGSVTFSKRLTGDILAFPEFKDATFSYMDIDRERLEVGAALCRKMAKARGANARIEATLDRREALKGADFVITMLLVGGFDSVLADFRIPTRYGLKQTIADTVGPAAVMKALRLFPVMSGIARDMEELCPDAVLLNYSNPMSMNMQSVFRTSGIRAVGLCHSIQGTCNELASYLDEDPARLTFVAGGINHMSFFTRFEKDGVDLYPRLFAAMERPEIYEQNKVRFEIMRRLGHFPTESSGHHSEYSPFFMPHGQRRIAEFDLDVDQYLHGFPYAMEEWERMKADAASDAPMATDKSHEYGSEIIHSMATGQPRVVYGNMPNGGAIDNLPRSAVVEAPTLVDRSGLRFGGIGELPPQCVGYVQPHIIQHELFIRAAMEGRRDHVYQAAMFDPNTAACISTDKIVEMCDELIEAHAQYLPKLEKKTLVPGSGRRGPRTDPMALRAEWDAEQRRIEEGVITEWRVVGPFPGEQPGRIRLDQETPVDRDLRTRGDGSIDPAASYKVGKATLAWKRAPAGKHAFVDLGAALGEVEWCIGYGYAEFEAAGGEALMCCGSDDGVRVWLNGTVVHSHEVGRGFASCSDRFTVTLAKGRNRLLVKVDNYKGGWGFNVAVDQRQQAGAAARAK